MFEHFPIQRWEESYYTKKKNNKTITKSLKANPSPKFKLVSKLDCESTIHKKNYVTACRIRGIFTPSTDDNRIFFRSGEQTFRLIN